MNDNLKPGDVIKIFSHKEAEKDYSYQLGFSLFKEKEYRTIVPQSLDSGNFGCVRVPNTPLVVLSVEHISVKYGQIILDCLQLKLLASGHVGYCNIPDPNSEHNKKTPFTFKYLNKYKFKKI